MRTAEAVEVALRRAKAAISVPEKNPKLVCSYVLVDYEVRTPIGIDIRSKHKGLRVEHGGRPTEGAISVAEEDPQTLTRHDRKVQVAVAVEFSCSHLSRIGHRSVEDLRRLERAIAVATEEEQTAVRIGADEIELAVGVEVAESRWASDPARQRGNRQRRERSVTLA